MQSHNINIYSTITYGSFLNSNSIKKYQLIANFDALKKPFLFSVLENYLQKFIYLIILQNRDFKNILNNYRILSLDTVYCERQTEIIFVQLYHLNERLVKLYPIYQLQVQYICIQGCWKRYQKLNATILMMKHLVSTFYIFRLLIFILRLSIFCTRYCIQQTNFFRQGKNLQGSNIFILFFVSGYTSLMNFWGSSYMFIGQIQKIYHVDPNRRITFTFQMFYSLIFILDGQFIHQVENNPPASQSISNIIDLYSNYVKQDRVNGKINLDTTKQQYIGNALDQIMNS
ncbi:unnamed protein product [Paramecium pentaurelia]|uniref:Transmembrane protein n=1 Tax=Paramecium pentaurelia TaxID=43138 RepID=A0A8S1VQB3_9CILI|nr:unnamed protein product [Paramecium pentaurelia]